MLWLTWPHTYTYYTRDNSDRKKKTKQNKTWKPSKTGRSFFCCFVFFLYFHSVAAESMLPKAIITVFQSWRKEELEELAYFYRTGKLANPWPSYPPSGLHHKAKIHLIHYKLNVYVSGAKSSPLDILTYQFTPGFEQRDNCSKTMPSLIAWRLWCISEWNERIH